jgi:hypothetical protein
MSRLLTLLFLAAIGVLFGLGVRSGAVTFMSQEPPQKLCAKVCAPASVRHFELQIDTRGIVKGFFCDCLP